MKKKIALLMAVVMLFGMTVGGTLAWLQAKTTPVVNTFTPAGIEIDLDETWNKDTNEDGTNDAWEAKLVPGKEYAKDPEVSVVRPDTDVDVYLFVKIVETNNPSEYLDYSYNLTGWTELTAGSGIYWREVAADDTEISWELLTGNKVTVKSDLQEKDMPTANPEITFTAYAIQTEGFTTPAAAWDEVSKLS